jgi:tetratricopeptide (TPR) repeat protein
LTHNKKKHGLLFIFRELSGLSRGKSLNIYQKKVTSDRMSVMALNFFLDNNRYRSLLILAGLILLTSSLVQAQKPTAKTFLDIGMRNSENSEFSEAIDAFRHAIKLKPDYAEAYFRLGNVYYSLHRYTEALESYKKAVEIQPEYKDAHITLGFVASLLSRYDEAVKSLKKVVELDPNNAKSYYNLGKIYLETEEYTKAAEAFDQAVTLEPDFAEAHYNLGVSYLNLGDDKLDAALKEYTILKKLNSGLADELNTLLKSQ